MVSDRSPDSDPAPLRGSPQRTDSRLLTDVDATSSIRTVNGVQLHVVAAGDPADPLVVLLHGFPEFFYGWREHVGPLVEAGYRVLVPDQRGYNLSEKGNRIWDYRIEALSRDVVDLIETEGRESAHVVGHDWGATVTWDVALRFPDAVNRVAVCNVPHPLVFRRHLRSNLEQLRRSWYILYFQLPKLPEWAARRNDFGRLVAALRATSEDDSFTEKDLIHYRSAWRVPGTLTAMLDWYRAGVRYGIEPPRSIVEQPTLVVWGERDVALNADMAPESLAYCADGRLERFPETGHWVIHDRADAVSSLILSHLDG